MANTTAGLLLNSTRIITETPQIERIDQCDYTLLFSHLHSQIRTAHQDILQNVYHSQEFQFEEEATYKLAVTSACVLFGLFFAICGYRCLKLSTFLVGFSLGAGIIYLILNEQKQLSNVENLIISVSIGVLFAFVALLVQYIGLFLIGITSSVSIVTCILILIDLFYTNQSAWVCIGLLFLCATVVASFTLKFQKSLTIVNTSIIGSALLFVAVDFVVENNLLMDYIFELFKVNGHIFNIYERQKALLHKSGSAPEITTTIVSELAGSATRAKMPTTTAPLVVENPFGTSANETSAALALFLRLYSSANAKLCWYTWCVFGSFFVILFFSLIIQFLCTGRRHDHRESWQKLIRGNRKRKTANLEKIRLKSNHLSDSESQHRHLTKSQHSSKNHRHHQTSQKDYSNSDSLSSSQLDLVAATANQTDTLRLVESGQSQLSYTGSSASDAGSSRDLSHKISNKKKQQTQVEDDFEIVSFEIIKSKSKSRKQQDPKQPTKPMKSKLTSATTTSTSSTSSTGSSTCQLIPMKLNNGSCGTNSTTAGLPNCPSPKATSTITTAHHSGTMLPPPVPTLPPPKLPVNLSTTLASNSNRTDTINSAVSLTNSILLPNQLFVPKLKSHRHTGTTSSKKSGDKVESSEHKFRQLYQIRRNNGDVLSQDFLKNFQAKQASSNQLNSSTIDSSFIDTNTFELRSASLSSGDKKKAAKSQEKQSKHKK